MIRNLLVPLVAAGLLAGCVTGDYAYRGGSGDYYYGRPSVEYRYHGAPYGYYPYGGFRYGYGHPYPYGHLFYGYPYGYPYSGYPYYRPRPPIIVQPRPDPGPRNDDDDRRPPWRDLDRRRRQFVDGGGMPATPTPDRAVNAPRRDGGSRMEQILRRSEERARSRSESDER